MTHRGRLWGGGMVLLLALSAVFRTGSVQLYTVATFLYPGRTHLGNTLHQVDFNLRVGIGSGGIVNRDRRVFLRTEAGRGIRLRNLAHGDPQIRSRTLHIYLC